LTGLPKPRDRRTAYRRMDDIVDALAQMNLVGASDLSEDLAERLAEVGVENPRSRTTAQLLQDAWVIQHALASQIRVERRRRSRRTSD
jgi:hypothetical protein